MTTNQIDNHSGVKNNSRWKPNVTVAAIVEQDTCFLLVEERIKGKAVLNQPAGHLEVGESLFEAVKREVLEETAWQFNPVSLVGIYLYTLPNNTLTYLRFCFYGECIHHELGRALDEEIIRTHWLTLKQIREKEKALRSPMVLRGIEDYLAGNCYSLDLIDQIKLG